MGENSKIEWTDHTFNPWIGCTKVHEGCAHCYAERDMDHRMKKAKWGPSGTRVLTSEANWKHPLKWDQEAKAAGVRRRVFCASLADVFENWDGVIHDHHGNRVLVCDECGRLHPDDEDSENGSCECSRFKPRMEYATLQDVRNQLFKLIDATPNLDWLLLTKRPEFIRAMWPQSGFADAGVPGSLGKRLYLENVWLGTSISTQAHAEKQIPELLKCRDLSPVLFLSIEPMLGPISFRWAKWQPIAQGPGEVTNELDGLRRLDWVICGGESGPNARPIHSSWVRQLCDQCNAAEVPFHFKQWGEWVPWIGRTINSLRLESPHLQTVVMPDGQQSKNLEVGGELMARVGKKAAGRMLDGREWSEFPEQEVRT